MAGQHLGAPPPASPRSPSSPTEQRQALHLVATCGTRTRRNHGAFTLGGQLACVYSSRRAGQCYGVGFELGAGTLTLASSMTPAQARRMAAALAAAADAAELAHRGQEGGAA
jgi:hypothetical protein